MKVINSNKIPSVIRKQFREALENLVTNKVSQHFATIEKHVNSILETFAVQGNIKQYHDVKVFPDPELPDVAHISFMLNPIMPPIEVEVTELPAWIEIKEDWQIHLENIPSDKSLGQALFEYLDKITPNRWQTGYDFIRLECAHCKEVTIYGDISDIPHAFGDNGSVDCPCCKTPWLFYSYGDDNV